MKNYIFLFIIFLIALYFRFENLCGHGLWIDECLYVGMVQNISTQELVPSLIGKLFSTDSEFWIRFPFAFAGSLTVLALYYAIENKKLALLIALFFAVCPLFVWWGRMARPYSIAGLFLALSWKHPLWMIPAVLSTPISILGLNLFKIKKYWKIFLFLCIGCIVIYFLREDHARGHWEVENILTSTRWFYLPSLTVLLYSGDSCKFFQRV